MPVKATLEPRGPFSLRASAEFGFGPHRPNRPYDGRLRLAFPVDGGRGYAGAILSQSEPDGPVEVILELRDGAGAETTLRQVARVLSLDHDGEPFRRVGERDRVIAALLRAHPGQRPVLFHSPYEAAAWSIISARRPAGQAARVRHALATELGASFELATERLAAFPQPERLLDLPADAPGLIAEKVARLHGVARAALEGALDVPRLRELGPESARAELRRLRGLGPFYADLIVLRACGFTDAMPESREPRVLAHAARFYALPEPPTTEQLRQMAEAWRPFRTWTIVLIRVAGDRAPAEQED